jgi:ATP-dependent Clp protease ATP-binding subunit ClpA
MNEHTTSTNSEKSIVGATSILDLLSEKIIGQETAISGIASTVKTYQAGLAPSGRPAGVFLLLGPTGTGKTRTVEALAEILHGSQSRVVKVVDCGEYQTDHEVAKLIGAPPGYLGHRETRPILTQDRLREATSQFCDLSVVLFDEIEKAAPTISRLLLGVLDKATLRLGDNTEVNFEKSLIFLTSNLGAREMMKELQPELGFRPAAKSESSNLTQRLEAIALNAVRRMYSPEFVNRLDAVITYQPLDSEALTLILDQQISDLQKHVNSRLGNKCFSIEISPETRHFLLSKGTSPEYGARELKRSIHKYLTQPLATLVIESRIQPGSTVHVSLNESSDALEFDTTPMQRPAAVTLPQVLIVDDNRDFLRLLSLELSEGTKWGVTTAQSVADVETLQPELPVDFALLDLILPDGNGIELGVKLKEQRPNLQVAIMTGAELTMVEEYDCRKHRFDIVNKPFLPQQIVSLILERVMKGFQAVA